MLGGNLGSLLYGDVSVMLYEYLMKTPHYNILPILHLHLHYYAPVICIPGSLGAGDTGDIAGLKCRNLTSDVSRQRRGFAGVLISR